MYTFLRKSIEVVLMFLKPRECLNQTTTLVKSLLECDTDHGNHEDADRYQ